MITIRNVVCNGSIGFNLNDVSCIVELLLLVVTSSVHCYSIALLCATVEQVNLIGLGKVLCIIK